MKAARLIVVKAISLCVCACVYVRVCVRVWVGVCFSQLYVASQQRMVLLSPCSVTGAF